MIDLDRFDVWIFDLDNTLYSADCNLFSQIDARMTNFIIEQLSLDYPQARTMQKDYYVRYGTTMSGLMIEHSIDPDQFLEFVHDIDVGVVNSDEALGDALAQLPGRKYIYTNGSVQHAENVTNALGITRHFDDVFDIKAAKYTPKPKRGPYEKFVEKFSIDPKRSVMCEDLAQNLETPHDLGMTTVLVCSDAAWLQDEPASKRPARPGETGDHIHYATQDLTQFLQSAINSKDTQ